MSKITFKSLKIKQLFDWFDQQCLAVPEIQREFVWNAQRTCALLDSIYKGYPIGTIMVWRTNSKNKWMLRHELHMLPPYDPMRNKDIMFLIDGQQRLSVLYQIQNGETKLNSNGQQIRFGDIYFSIDESDQQFVYKRRPDPELHFKVSHILSNRWKRKFRGLYKYQKVKIEECRKKLLNYELFVIFTHTTEQADVREAFIRINSQGMRISEADKAFSRAEKVKPLHRYRNLCQNLPYGFKSLDKAVYWTTLVLARGTTDLGQKAFNRLSKEINTEKGRVWFERQEPKIAESIRLACDYLVNKLRVYDFKLIPYENMIAVLAVFFYWNNRAQPTSRQREQIRRWFWHTAVVQRYAGAGYYPNILGDTLFFKRLGRTRFGKYIINERVSLQTIRLSEYNRASALSKAYQLLLIHNKPRYITNGEQIPLGPVAAQANTKELHHIFPRDKLKIAGFSIKKYNNLANICMIVAHDNRSFGSKLPHSYLEEFKHKKHFARSMKSHLIPYDLKSSLWGKKARSTFNSFIDARLNVIKKAFHAVSGAKLFE